MECQRGPLAALSIFLSLLGAVQTAVYAAWFWPAAWPVNKQLGIYVLFLAAAFGSHAWGHPWVARHWPDDQWRRKLRVFLALESILTFLLLSALFKLIIYDRWPQLALNAHHALLVLLLLNKIFYKFIFNGWSSLCRFMTLPSNHAALFFLAQYCFIFFLVFLLYLPDAQGIVARVFIAEQFHNWDLSVFGPAFAYEQGCVLNVDVTSRYGLGMPMAAATVMKLMGGLSYEHLLQMLMGLCIAYYAAWFVLLRQWLGGVLVPMATVLFAIRTQMFHTGAYPLTFTYPSGTPLRFFMDVIVFFLLWNFLKTRRPLYLWASSFCCGFMIFYMFAEGIYLTGAFYVFLALYVLNQRTRGYLIERRKDLWRVGGYFIAVPLVALGLMFLTQGQRLFTPAFWHNMAEYRDDFLSGLSVSPIYSSLVQGNFLQSLMGFALPLVYVATLLVAGGLWCLGLAPQRYLLAVAIAVNGLGLYHYYTLLSLWTGYYMLGVPFNILIGFWANEILQNFSSLQRRRAGFVLVAVCLWALLTNHNFISYPNLMNFSRNPMVDQAVVQAPPGRVSYFNHLFREYPDAFKLPENSLGEKDEDLKMEKDFLTDEELKAYYRREINFKRDAALIRKFTGPHEAVPLIAGFDIEFLLQAGRKPFFYYFPILNSRPLRMRIFHAASMGNYRQLKKTIDDLEEKKPQYVFMERIYLNRRVPQSYFYDTPGLVGMLAYIHEHYEPVETGEYLVAMRRKAR